VLPRLGLRANREGRNLYVQKSEEDLRFYHLDQLAMARTGSKTYQVNGSGQGAGGTGATGTAGPAGTSGGGAYSTSYSSSVELESASDPWGEVENGLMLLVFGRTVERQAAPAATPGAGAAATAPRGYASGGRTLLIQPGSGLVAVGADPSIQRHVAAYLQEVQGRAERQVLLEARIVEVTLNNDSQMGVDWSGLASQNGNPALSSFSSGGVNNPNVGASQGLMTIVAQKGRVQAALTALARDQRLNVLSAPRLATLNNQKAILRVVQEQAFAIPSSQITPGTAAGGAVATTQLTPLIVPVGITLDILPQVGDDGYISLSVNPSISEVASTTTISEPVIGAIGLNQGQNVSMTLPVINRRDLDAVVRVKSGETLVLAGIIMKRENQDNRGVPWLRRIPILGALFAKDEKSASRTELAIFITPTLMETSAQVAAQRGDAEKRLEQAGQELKPPPPPAKPGFKDP
jgi:MSHA biogenesis protein MshL